MAIIATAIITALVVNGLWLASEEHQLLYPLNKAAKRLPQWIGKPFILCVICMAGSLWNAVVVFLYYITVQIPITWEIVPHIVLNGLAATYLASVAYRLYEIASQKARTTNPCNGECAE